MSQLEAPGVDRTIYPMPVFVSLRVTDLAASTRWYEEVGFVVLATMPGPDGPSSLVHLRRMTYQDMLMVRGEPEPGLPIGFAAGEDDLGARADRVRAHAKQVGAGSARGPEDTPWYTSDLTITDPDGYRVVLTAPRMADIESSPEWSHEVSSSVGRHPMS